MTVPISNERVRPLERNPNPLHSLLNEEFKKLPSEREFTLELIAEDKNGVAVGFVQCKREHDPFSGVARGYIQVLAVLEEAEGQGIGRLLLERATLWAQEKGLEGLSLHVFSSNVKARAFYAKLGFQEDNIRFIKPDQEAKDAHQQVDFDRSIGPHAECLRSSLELGRLEQRI